MSLLRFIDADGREQNVDNLNHLYELIIAGRVCYDTLVWDDGEQRWIPARDHDIFRRIQEIASQTATSQNVQPTKRVEQPVYPTQWIGIKRDDDAVPISSAHEKSRSAGSGDRYRQKDSAEWIGEDTSSPPIQRRNPTPEALSPTTETKWFKLIKTREEALKMIKTCALTFFAIAGIQAALIGFLVLNYPETSSWALDSVINSVLFVIFGAWLMWGRSRIAAIVLLLLTIGSTGTSIAAKAKVIEGGTNIWLAVILLWMAARAVESTFKLRGRFANVAPQARSAA